MKTLEEWKFYYEKKSGFPVKERAYAKTEYHPELGFMVYMVNPEDKDKFIIMETAGNGKYWQRVAVELAKHCGCKEIFTTVYIDPKAYMRRFPETKVFGTIMRMEVG